jgi:hypothetical protein
MKIYHQGQLDFFCAIYAVINALGITYGMSLQDGRHILGACIKELAEHKNILAALTSNATDHHWIVGYLLGRFCRSGRFALKVAKLPPKLPSLATDAWLNLDSPEAISLNDISEQDMWAEVRSFSGSFSGLETQGLDKPPGPRWRAENLWTLLQGWLPSRGLLGVLGTPKLQDRCILLRFHRFFPQAQGPLISHWSTGRNFSKDILHLADCTSNPKALHALPLKECVMDSRDLGGERQIGIEPESVWFLEKA